MAGFAARQYRRARKAVRWRLRKHAPWMLRTPAAEPEGPSAPFSALNLERLRQAGGYYPGSIRRTSHAEDLAALLAGRADVAHFVDHVDYERPPADLVFAGVCNDKYAPGLEALILSLLRVYPGLENRFVVYHDASLSEFSRQRLSELYPHFEFLERDPHMYAVSMTSLYNHKRVGLLGYLTLEVLAMEEPSWVVVLDTDLLVLGDISPLWHGDSIKAVPDIGLRPYAIQSEATGRNVINSGVLSLPRSARGPEATARRDRILSTIDQVTDPAIFRFADQKFWNLYLSECEVEELPQNFNTNKILLPTAYRDQIGAVKILHMTGPKPWYQFVNNELLTEDDVERYRRGITEFQTSYALWNQAYLSEITAARVRLFRESEGAALAGLAGGAQGRPMVMIGNGPSLRDTDMTAFDGYEKVAFNWFVNHDDFDTIRPDHLVLASHMLFGGWHTPRPELPAEFIAALARHAHRPVVWAPFYFKSYLETVPELSGHQIRYFLFEKPFKRRLAHAGWAPLDLTAPLVDSNTGVLTVGVPLAVHRGASHVVLVGCDSNYSSTAGSYFYAAGQHASRTTREETLLATWEADGEGPFGYLVIARELAKRGVPFLDATVGGSLEVVDKVSIEQARALASG